jgi:hypothetical protein
MMTARERVEGLWGLTRTVTSAMFSRERDEA